MKLRLIDDARRWWRMFSVQMMLASGAVQSAWEGLPADLKQYLPAWLGLALSLSLLGLGVGGRLIKQPKATPVATSKIAAGESAQ